MSNHHNDTKAIELDLSELVAEPTEGPKKWAQESYADRRNKLQKMPFIAWDGEGYDDETGKHHYMLFGNSNGEYIRGASLDYKDCFEILLNAKPGNHVIFGGDYDVIMMTREMPIPKLKRLLKGKPIRVDQYRMQWFRKKYFDLSDGQRRIRLYDVMTFFGTSFVNACREYLGNSPALDTMHEMKLKRGEFTMDDGDVLGYWKSELQYLVDLMNTLRGLLHKVGIEPTGWHGPGAVAGGLLKAHKMGQYMEPQPEKIIDLAERAYYGGRFEQFKVGRVEHVHEYDIRSAYPAAIAKLPSLVGVTWKHETSNFSGSTFGLYCVSWDLRKHPKLFPPIGIPGPLPWRSSHGNIYYPLTGFKCWYWGIEIQNLLFFKGCYEIHESYIPQFPTRIPDRPFTWVEDMYNQRAAMKELDNPAQLAVKLGMNSLYGKLAQSKGSKYNKETQTWTKPRWHNIIYAGWITAYTRREIFNALLKAMKQRNTIAVETDAIFSEKPLDLDIGTGLGQWEHTPMEQILYVHSGVYYALRHGVWKLKSRGVEIDKSQSADYWVDIFEKLPGSTVEVTARIRRFGTIPNSDNYSRWYDFERKTELPSLKSKRVHYPPFCLACIDDSINGTETTFADETHNLAVPMASEFEYAESTPYPFPWRNDVEFEWPTEWVVREADEPMEVSWV